MGWLVLWLVGQLVGWPLGGWLLGLVRGWLVARLVGCMRLRHLERLSVPSALGCHGLRGSFLRELGKNALRDSERRTEELSRPLQGLGGLAGSHIRRVLPGKNGQRIANTEGLFMDKCHWVHLHLITSVK